jgi:hypothetical protein
VRNVVAEHASGCVDVLDSERDTRELRRPEEREVTRLRQELADGQRAIALGLGWGLVAACGAFTVTVVAAARSESEGPGEGERG